MLTTWISSEQEHAADFNGSGLYEVSVDTFSLRFNGHFPGEPALAGVY